MARFPTRIALLAALSGLPASSPRTSARADEPARPSLADVGRIVRAGNDAAALAELARLEPAVRTSPAAELLEARLSERTGRLVRAEAALARALDAGLPSFAERDARARRARLLARIGRCTEAIPLLREDGSPRARAVAGECALAAHDLDAAITLLESVDREAPGPVDGVAVRLALAEAVRQKGDAPRALTILRTTWLERPTHRDRPALEQAIRAIDANALTMTDAERETEITTLVTAGAFTQARRALEALPAAATIEARVARLRRIAELAMRGRAYRDAGLAYERAFAASNDDADLAGRARALVREGEHERALPLLDRIARAHAGERLADDAAQLAADVALGLGEPARAVRYVAEHRSQSASALRVELFLHGLATDDIALAEQHIDAVARVSDSFRDVRTRYLRARLAEAKRDRSAATSQYRALVDEDPLSYYGLVAAVRLRGLGASVPVPSLEIGPLPASAPLPEDVAFYYTLGLDDDAREALRRAEGGLRARLGANGLAAMYLAIGGTARAYSLARGEIVAGKTAVTDDTRALFHAAYPRPFAAEVASTAHLFDIREAHVYGTMRQESAYDPDARSHAGALGLLQVMPGTARRVAVDVGLDPDTIDPFDPHTNVRLGIGEMAALARRFDGQLPLVVAAYNAGSGRVIRWLPAARHMPTDLFIERIPYDETRGYVRRVIAHFAVYSVLADRPEDVLAGLPTEVVGH